MLSDVRAAHIVTDRNYGLYHLSFDFFILIAIYFFILHFDYYITFGVALITYFYHNGKDYSNVTDRLIIIGLKKYKQ